MKNNTESLFDNNNQLTVDLSYNLEDNIAILKKLFDRCGDVVQKSFVLEREKGPVKIHIIYIDGLTDNKMIEETIIRPLSYEWRGNSEKSVWESILYREAQTVDIRKETSFDRTVASVLKGDTAVFVNGYKEKD